MHVGIKPSNLRGTTDWELRISVQECCFCDIYIYAVRMLQLR